MKASDVQIREGTESDAASIHALNSAAFGYPYDQIRTKVRIASILDRGSDRILVAVVDGVVAGYIHGSDYESTYVDPLKNVMALAVDEQFRGRGIGKALLAALEHWARDCGCCGVRLVSGFDREDAHAFYEKCGYKHRKLQKNFIKLFT